MSKRTEHYYDENGKLAVREVKKKRNPFLLGCLGLLLLFILLGACGALLGGNDTKEEKATTEQKNTTKDTTKEDSTTEEVTTEAPETEEKKNEATREQKAALGKAKTYSEMMHMSKQGIVNQLTSEIEGFSQQDAQYAVDNLKADFKENALKKAETYAKTQNMSNDAIYNQLTSSIEGFTAEEAQYAVDNLK
ncbi:Ltp family lipoprotein [Macrococcoides caseolyticum]|uniref:Ltp family lipoprotein n=1 Tax=Macrococcoides caseolyticum TaxID=69966 RepID=UPI000C3480D6|nr:Ltp family lipoprotein [Macrococcus caseolyticus]PKE33985.1 hypothetical protein CW668_04145 [Macrococcus caseolyticus]